MQHTDNMFPRRRTLLIVSVSLISGILFGAAFFAYISTVASPRTSEPVMIQGLFNLKAYHPNGALFYSSTGHNTLTENAFDLVTLCALGDTSGPFEGVVCTKAWTSAIFVGTSALANQLPDPNCPTGGYPSAGCDEATVSSSTGTTGSPGSQSSCNPSNGYCTGWNVTATISSVCTDTVFCPFTVAVVGAGVFDPSQNLGGFPTSNAMTNFDQINLCANGCQAQQVTLNKGDSLQVTIAFVIS